LTNQDGILHKHRRKPSYCMPLSAVGSAGRLPMGAAAESSYNLGELGLNKPPGRPKYLSCGILHMTVTGKLLQSTSLYQPSLVDYVSSKAMTCEVHRVGSRTGVSGSGKHRRTGADGWPHHGRRPDRWCCRDPRGFPLRPVLGRILQ